MGAGSWGARWFWEALKDKRRGVTGSLKIKSLNRSPVPATNEGASQKKGGDRSLHRSKPC